MKCVECGRSVSNWPAWLEQTKIIVRCDRCANAQPTAINAPGRRDEKQAEEPAAR